MKILTIIVRVLVGLLLLFASVTYLFKIGPVPPEATGNMKIFNDGIEASGYMMPLVKVLELICGLAFVTGRFVALANLVILPITINIFLVHLFMLPDGLTIAAPLLIANIFLIFRYWSNYWSVFAVK